MWCGAIDNASLLHKVIKENCTMTDQEINDAFELRERILLMRLKGANLMTVFLIAQLPTGTP